MPDTLTFAVTQIIRRPAVVLLQGRCDIAPLKGHCRPSQAAIQKLKGQAYLNGERPRESAYCGDNFPPGVNYTPLTQQP